METRNITSKTGNLNLLIKYKITVKVHSLRENKTDNIMKRNSYDIDNRTEWKMRKIIHNNELTHSQLDNLFEYAGADRYETQTQK